MADKAARERVVALTDLGALFEVALAGEREYGVPLGEGDSTRASGRPRC